MNSIQIVACWIAVSNGPHRFITRLASGPSQTLSRAANKLPDKPIACLQPNFCGSGDVWSVLDGFKHFRKEPFQTDRATIPLQKGFLARFRNPVHPIGLLNRTVMFPEFRPGERHMFEQIQFAKRHAIASCRQHGTASEIDADADDICFRNSCFRDRRASRDRRRLDPIAGGL